MHRTMNEQSLSLSFGNSLTEEVAGIAGEYAELGLDALVEEGLFKEIPIVSTAAAVYRIGKSIREKHHVAKLISFLNEINNGIVDGEKREVYREKFATNEKFRNQELEYILILTDRYIGFDKPQMLAKLYLAYLDEIINWMTFIKYAECIDRFLPGDQLVLDSTEIEKAQYNDNYDAVSRLEALGLIGRKVEVVPIYHEQEQNLELKNSDEYTLTGFGWKLKQILESY